MTGCQRGPFRKGERETGGSWSLEGAKHAHVAAGTWHPPVPVPPAIELIGGDSNSHILTPTFDSAVSLLTLLIRILDSSRTLNRFLFLDSASGNRPEGQSTLLGGARPIATIPRRAAGRRRSEHRRTRCHRFRPGPLGLRLKASGRIGRCLLTRHSSLGRSTVGAGRAQIPDPVRPTQRRPEVRTFRVLRLVGWLQLVEPVVRRTSSTGSTNFNQPASTRRSSRHEPRAAQGRARAPVVPAAPGRKRSQPGRKRSV